jgi:hypothetical protein
LGIKGPEAPLFYLGLRIKRADFTKNTLPEIRDGIAPKEKFLLLEFFHVNAGF